MPDLTFIRSLPIWFVALAEVLVRFGIVVLKSRREAVEDTCPLLHKRVTQIARSLEYCEADREVEETSALSCTDSGADQVYTVVGAACGNILSFALFWALRCCSQRFRRRDDDEAEEVQGELAEQPRQRRRGGGVLVRAPAR